MQPDSTRSSHTAIVKQELCRCRHSTRSHSCSSWTCPGSPSRAFGCHAGSLTTSVPLTSSSQHDPACPPLFALLIRLHTPCRLMIYQCASESAGKICPEKKSCLVPCCAQANHIDIPSKTVILLSRQSRNSINCLCCSGCDTCDTCKLYIRPISRDTSPLRIPTKILCLTRVN